VPAHLLDDLRRERLAHQRAQARVIGRVAEQHGARQRAGLGAVAVHRREQLGEALPAEALIA
jgi:hypothetical protein